MEKRLHLGFLFGLALGLILGGMFYRGRLILPGFEPLLSLNQLAFEEVWILLGLLFGLIFTAIWSILISFQQRKEKKQNRPAFQNISLGSSNLDLLNPFGESPGFLGKTLPEE